MLTNIHWIKRSSISKLSLAIGLSFISLAHANYYSQNNSGYTNNYPPQNYGYSDQNQGNFSSANRTYSENFQDPNASRNYSSDQRSSSSYNQNDYSPVTTDTYGNYNSNQNERISDQELLSKVRDKISSGWFSKGYDQVDVKVNDGNVTLAGTVKTLEEKEKVEKEVRNIKGVRNVNSQISVPNQMR